MDQSSSRLRSTRDQHKTYAGKLGSGAQTLSELRWAERKANLVLGVSIAVFFIVALLVTQKRLANSNTATFIVRPAMTLATFPVRVTRTVVSVVARVSKTGKRARLRNGNDTTGAHGKRNIQSEDWDSRARLVDSEKVDKKGADRVDETSSCTSCPSETQDDSIESGYKGDL